MYSLGLVQLFLTLSFAFATSQELRQSHVLLPIVPRLSIYLFPLSVSMLPEFRPMASCCMFLTRLNPISDVLQFGPSSIIRFFFF
ncbi:hypothetical protein C8R41DRAFT_359034 [Lentinula lateritia]|uniref:Secreted protein n=1 Tax=Lentinula lateritia TaxID=40482 RepID=A0ABQ8VX29_9AGAR|nr:hypothetical protein C8R41DRAFT_359034 [Lentinula lateritia]